jgi:hypothetical protein
METRKIWALTAVSLLRTGSVDTFKLNRIRSFSGQN